MIKIFPLFVMFQIVINCRSVYGSERFYVGVLETEGVRAAFVKDKKWLSREIRSSDLSELKKTFHKFNNPTSWTIYFDNNVYGSFKTKDFGEYKYHQVGLQSINGNVPTLSFRKESKDFQNFNSEASLRPVVLSSLTKISDPESWKLGPLSKVQIEQAEKAKLLMVNTFKKFSKPKDPTKQFTSQSFTLLKSYTSNRGSALVQIAFDDSQGGLYCLTNDSDCSDSESRWAFINGKNIKIIGRASSLIDVGDFDLDKKSEFVFFISRYNEDGYALYAPQEDSWIEFTWNYH